MEDACSKFNSICTRGFFWSPQHEKINTIGHECSKAKSSCCFTLCMWIQQTFAKSCPDWAKHHGSGRFHRLTQKEKVVWLHFIARVCACVTASWLWFVFKSNYVSEAFSWANISLSWLKFNSNITEHVEWKKASMVRWDRRTNVPDVTMIKTSAVRSFVHSWQLLVLGVDAGVIWEDRHDR